MDNTQSGLNRHHHSYTGAGTPYPHFNMNTQNNNQYPHIGTPYVQQNQFNLNNNSFVGMSYLQTRSVHNNNNQVYIGSPYPQINQEADVRRSQLFQSIISAPYMPELNNQAPFSHSQNASVKENICATSPPSHKSKSSLNTKDKELRSFYLDLILCAKNQRKQEKKNNKSSDEQVDALSNPVMAEVYIPSTESVASIMIETPIEQKASASIFVDLTDINDEPESITSIAEKRKIISLSLNGNNQEILTALQHKENQVIPIQDKVIALENLSFLNDEIYNAERTITISFLINNILRHITSKKYTTDQEPKTLYNILSNSPYKNNYALLIDFLSQTIKKINTPTMIKIESAPTFTPNYQRTVGEKYPRNDEMNQQTISLPEKRQKFGQGA